MGRWARTVARRSKSRIMIMMMAPKQIGEKAMAIGGVGKTVLLFCLTEKYASENNDCISEHLMFPDSAETFRKIISNY